MMTANMNPITLRDLLLEERNGFVREDAIRSLVLAGWPTEAILAELPEVSERWRWLLEEPVTDTRAA